MSYKHLAGRLIETQRSMLGEPAIEIARSTEGITVTADGTVSCVDGDGRVVVDELARRYTDMLGNAAEMRLLAAAREFEDELALPSSLGGHADVDPSHRDPATHDPAGPGPATYDPADDGSESVTSGTEQTESPETPGSGTDGPPPVDAHGPDPDTGAVSDGGAVESQSSADATTRVVSPTPSGPGEVVSSTPSPARDAVSPTTGASGRSREETGTPGDERVVETPEASRTAGTTADTADSRDDGAGASTAVDGESASYDRAVDDSEIALEDPVTVRYTVASDLGTSDEATADLSSVYLLPDGEAEWQVPVTVEEAVAGAVAEALDCEPAAVDNATDPVEVDRLLATLRGERGDTVSFELHGPLRGLTVTFHHTGSLAVH